MSDEDMIRRGDAKAVLMKAQIASCTCQTKTDDPDWHRDGCKYRILRDAEAMIDHVPPAALPAAQVTVKPGEIERAVWSAMMWAADNNPGFNGVPEYTDGGNSFAETECRSAAARIRSALTVTTHDPAKVQALVEAVQAYIDRSEEYQIIPPDRGGVHGTKGKAFIAVGDAYAELRAALAAWKEK